MKRIESRDNPLVKRVRALAASARDCRKFGQTVLDGAHLLTEALAHDWPLRAVLFSDRGQQNAEIAALATALEGRTECASVPDALFAQLSPVDAPSGVLALIDLPQPASAPRLDGSVLVLDGVQDPGNLGSLLRTAAAAGLREVLLGTGCAQAWSPRALRAGMGAHFRLAVHERVELPAALAGFAGPVLATALDEDACSLYELDLTPPLAWLFGGEGQGLSPALLARADHCVRIPLASGVESLNVGAAAAVCLFEQARQRALAQR